jgi:RsiW-degrading membrane proteinase PrsW (M82 family)
VTSSDPSASGPQHRRLPEAGRTPDDARRAFGPRVVSGPLARAFGWAFAWVRVGPGPAGAPAQDRANGGHPVHLRPAFWVTLALLGVGGYRISLVLHRAFVAYPKATAVAIALFLLYAVPFVLLVRVIDYLEREPLLLQATAVAWGGLVATSAAISGSGAVQDILAKVGSPRFATDWGPAIGGAALEEILKVLGVVMIALLARSQINSMVDGFVYGALVGLGFQVVEDVVFAVNAVASGSGTDQVGPVVGTFLLRGFLGGLWSHTLFTALSGAGVAYFLVRRDRPVRIRVAVAAVLFLVAWGFHFLWNSPVLGEGSGYGIVGLVGVLLLKGIPALLVGVVLIVAAEQREADYYAAMLAALADPRMATPDEIRALVSPLRRFAARRHARLRLGRSGGRAVRRLQRAQARLAVAVSRDPAAVVTRRRREVLTRRHQLLALGLAAGTGPAKRAAALTFAATVVAELAMIGVIVFGVGLAIRAFGGT